MRNPRSSSLDRRHSLSAIVAGAILSLAILGSAAPASAHSGLARAVPAPGARVSPAPTAVALTFTEALEPQFSTIEVHNAQRQRVDKADSHIAPDNPEQLIVDLEPLPPGVYFVFWRVTSVDTHRTTGSYPFTVKP